MKRGFLRDCDEIDTKSGFNQATQQLTSVFITIFNKFKISLISTLQMVSH